MNDNFSIKAALPSDKAAILNLLSQTDLPHDGVADHLKNFLVAHNQFDELVACASLERHGKLGLLRSVAVAPDRQKSGLGLLIVAAIITEAQKSGIKEIVLLTTTAREFFARRFQFVEANREDYNESLNNSPEWTLPRCSSAVVMRLHL